MTDDQPSPAQAAAEELQPCPFCGSNFVLQRSTSSVDCEVCGASGPMYPPAISGPERLTAWNTRPHYAAQAAEVERLTRERDGWIESARQYSHGSEYYQSLLDQIATNFGEAAYTSDDGSVQQDPLRAKMPELVAAHVAEQRQENADLVIVNLLLRGENEKLKVALRESVKLQSHYARLLNGWDGGERTIFSSMDDWLARLDECNAFGEPQ